MILPTTLLASPESSVADSALLEFTDKETSSFVTESPPLIPDKI